MNLRLLWYSLIGVRKMYEEHEELKVRFGALKRIVERGVKIGVDCRYSKFGNTTVAVVCSAGEGYFDVFELDVKELKDIITEVERLKLQYPLCTVVVDAPRYVQDYFEKWNPRRE